MRWVVYFTRPVAAERRNRIRTGGTPCDHSFQMVDLSMYKLPEEAVRSLVSWCDPVSRVALAVRRRGGSVQQA